MLLASWDVIDNGDRTVNRGSIDKVASVPRARIGSEIGCCSEAEIDAVDRALRAWLSLD